MSSNGGFGLEVSKGLLAKVILALVGFLGSVVFARVLGPAGYGTYYVILSVAAVMDNPISGFGIACKKRISEADSDTGEILVAGLLIAAIGSLLMFVGVFLLAPWIDRFDTERGLLFVALVFTALVFFKMIQPMVAGVGEFGTAIVLDMVRSLLTIPLQIVLVVSVGLGVGGMVYGLTGATLLTLPLALWVLGVRPSIPSLETMRSLWVFARHSIPGNFVGTAYGKLDVLLLSALLSSAAAGQYQIALQLTLPGLLLASVMGSGLFVEVSSQVSRDEDVADRITTNVGFASVFSVPLLFGALAMPESIVVTVFGPEYRAAAPLLIGLAFFQFLRTQATQVSSVLMGHDRPDLDLAIKTVTLVVNLVLGVALVLEIGAIGVVIATVAAEGTKFALLTYFARQHVAYAIVPDLLRYQFLAAAGMFVVVAGLHRVVGVNSWFDLLVLVGLGAGVYGVALLALSDVFMIAARSIAADAREQYL